MSLDLYLKTDKKVSSEITQSNILNYKRRSKLISKTNYYDNSTHNTKTIINTLHTLQNCYNALYDIKNILSDYLKNERQRINTNINYSNNNTEINSFVQKYKIEVISAFNILNKYNKNKKNNREENKLLKNINNIVQIIQLIYNDILRIDKTI